MNLGNGEIKWLYLRHGYLGYLRPNNYFWSKAYYEFMRILYAREHDFRARTAKSLNSDHPIHLDPQKGYQLVDLSGHKTVRKALEQCDRLRSRDDFERGLNQSKKGFLKNFPIDLEQPGNKAILDLVCSPLVLGPIAEYLGGVPVLHRIGISWSPNKTFFGDSQRYHLDREDWRQVKCHVFLEDIDEDSGPLTVIPADKSRKIFEQLRKKGQTKYKFSFFDDAAIYKAMREKSEIPLCGPRGSVAFVDTCNCYHYGSRPAQRDRLVLYLHYASAFSIDLPVWGRHKPAVAAASAGSVADEICSQVLGLSDLHVSKAINRRWASMATEFWAELAGVIPVEERYILVDDCRLSRNGWAYLPFLERDGSYFGQPPDDNVAIAELERMRQTGARFAVFPWFSFWWFEHYKGFYRHLRSTYHRLARTRRLVVFDLR